MPRSWLRPLLVLLAAASCFFWGLSTYGDSGPLGTVELSETTASDWLFVWRHRLAPHSVKLDSRVLLLTVDRPAEVQLGKPAVLWTRDMAEICQKLRQSGAAAVGLDFAGDPFMDKSPASLRALVEEGYAALQDAVADSPVVLIENDVTGELQQPAWPASVVAFADEGRNSCLANFLVDPDGTIRRLPLVGLQQDRGWVNHTFALRVAELGLGLEMSKTDQGWNFPRQGWPSQGRGDTLRINHPGPPGTIPQESLARYFERAAQPGGLEFYKGKFILIVPDFPSDRHATPFVSTGLRRTLGGEIHAAALNSVLTGAYLRRAPAWQWALILATGSLLSGLVAAYRTPLFSLLACLGGSLAYYLVALACFIRWGYILPLWSWAPCLSAGFLIGFCAQFLLLEERRLGLHRLLGRMVSRQVAEAMLEQPRLRAERRQITLLFSDINGFTPACERLAPEQVLSMLNAYFQEMVSLIDARGGYVKQFVGDEIMAIYGAPRPSTSHPRDAVYTAIEMIERLNELKRSDPTQSEGFYSVKLGINTGEAVLGSVGSAERWEYAAVGDDVNLAARLESLAGKLGYDVLVSKFTRDLVEKLPPGWIWKSIGTQTFKGKTSQLEVYTLEKLGGETS
ncbi:MAG: adenylate/guanylate cyclase domain-containing protein [Candidatus Eremiobacteraeota bacterium]|nr:adenylate/guanylate cyclase domain-containing protein [Candidatus Eremiobacteraeota bacterium]